MAVEVWARNPHSYIRECLDADMNLIAWDRGILVKYRIDPHVHGVGNFRNRNFRSLAIGAQGAAELGPLHTMHNPVAVYPVWEYNQHSLDQLEAWLDSNPAKGLRERALSMGRPPHEVPVEGQEHRVVIIRSPAVDTGIGMKFLSTLGLMQLDYPKAIIHVHGYTTFRWISTGVRSGDLDLRFLASKGWVFLPTGVKMPWERAAAEEHKWINILGWKPTDLAVPRNRCMFNIQAAKWAGSNWAKDPRLASTRQFLKDDEFVRVLNGAVELETKEAKSFSDVAGKSKGGRLPLTGDKFFCEACSYAKTCRAFRAGSICSVPDSEATDLARHFKTRDSAMIIEGLGKLIEGGIERLVEGRQIEQVDGRLDPQVTRIQDNLFRQGATLAKMVDPRLRSAAVAIQMNGGNGAISIGGANGTQPTLQEKVSGAVAALERAGVPPKMITEEMIERCLALGTDSEALERIVIGEAANFALPSGLFDGDDDEAIEAEIVNE